MKSGVGAPGRLAKSWVAINCGLATASLDRGATVGDLSAKIVAEVVRSNNARDVANIVKRHADILVLNANRGVLQMIGCGDRIVAQVPLAAELVEEAVKSSGINDLKRI